MDPNALDEWARLSDESPEGLAVCLRVRHCVIVCMSACLCFFVAWFMIITVYPNVDADFISFLH